MMPMLAPQQSAMAQAVVCANCGDSGEINAPVSDYIRELDVKSGHADRPLFTTKFCGCPVGKAQARKTADRRFD